MSPATRCGTVDPALSVRGGARFAAGERAALGPTTCLEVSGADICHETVRWEGES